MQYVIDSRKPKLPTVVDVSRLKAVKGKVLNRLTLLMNDNSHVGATLYPSNPLLQPFDVVAVQPGTEHILTEACSSGCVDVIAVDAGGKLPFHFRRPHVEAAVANGVYFALEYTTCLHGGWCADCLCVCCRRQRCMRNLFPTPLLWPCFFRVQTSFDDGCFSEMPSTCFASRGAEICSFAAAPRPQWSCGPYQTLPRSCPCLAWRKIKPER